MRVGCPAHNCGGRCLLIAHVKDGVITRLDTDDRPDSPADPQLRACARGRAYLRRQYHPERLSMPLIRTGKRGEGEFAPITWNEALDILAGQIKRVREKYGNGALFVPYGTGSYNQTNGSQTARRLMNLYGGCLGIWNSYSWGAINVATPTVYGTLQTGNQRQDWLNSKYILMWGWNPAEMRDGTNSEYFIKLARQNGARVVCIDPRHTLSAAALADEWVPIRPGTDAAMMSAMAYVMIREGLVDQEFVRTHCQGFDGTQMPAGFEDAESYTDYILGTRDGTPKTPAWAEAIYQRCPARPSGVSPVSTPPSSRACSTRAMACSAARMASRWCGQAVRWQRSPAMSVSPAAGRAVWRTSRTAVDCGTSSPPARTPMARPSLFSYGPRPSCGGKRWAAQDGVTGKEKLESNIKLIYAVASNILINQHANTNRSARILADTELVEFIAVQDQFLTPSARFADLVLPACTQFETWGVEDGWKYGEEVILMPKLVEPLGESKSDYRICAEVAERLGTGEAYTEGRDERGWVEWALGQYRQRRFPELPSLDELLESNAGVYSRAVEQPAVAFADFRADPAAHPLPTPSGKVEIFSVQLHEMGRPEEIPAVPKYIQEWESPFGPEAQEYPLQAIGHHTMGRVHSTHANNDWLEAAFPQVVYMNGLDAKARRIKDGELVRVYNGRGALVLPCKLTPRILPGVVDIPQGAWWAPDERGFDHGGNVNVLTSERWTPLAFATAQQTIMVEVKKFT